MKPAVLADTGPLYAAVDPDDQHHNRAQHELKQLDADRLTVFLAYPVLLEAYTLIVYRIGTNTSLSWLREVLAGTAPLNPTPDDYRTAADRVGRYPDQTITLYDATLAVLPNRLKVPVWTYDHHFDLMGVDVWR